MTGESLMSRPGFGRLAVLLSAEERAGKEFHNILALPITLKNSARKWNQRCINPIYFTIEQPVVWLPVTGFVLPFFLPGAPARFWVFRSIYDPQWML